MFKILKGIASHALCTGISVFLKLPQKVAGMLDFAMSNDEAFGASLIFGGIIGWSIYFMLLNRGYPKGSYEAVISLYDDVSNYASYDQCEPNMSKNIAFLDENKGSYVDTKIKQDYLDFMQAVKSVKDVKKNKRDDSVDWDWVNKTINDSYPKLKKAFK